MEENKNIRSIYISEKEINEKDLVSALIKDVEEDLKENVKLWDDWVKIQNKALYYVISKNIIIADSRRWQCSYSGYATKLDGIAEEGHELGYYLAKYLFYDHKSRNPLMDGDYIRNADGYTRLYVACNRQGQQSCIHLDSCNYYDWNFNKTDVIKIPYLSSNYSRMLLTFIQYGLIPDKTKIPEEYKLLEKLYSDGIVTIKNEKLRYNISEIKETEIYAKLKEEYIKSISTEKMKKDLLRSDKNRADIEEYDPTILTDIGVGHWDLWEMSQEKEHEVKLTESLVARNPLSDVLDDGIIGIDFGTRSTVVGYQNGSENIHLLRIGKGNLRSRATKSDYENPTIIEFDDINSFLKSYTEKDGRPNTSWDDIKVSHTANFNFNNNTKKEDSDNFYSFFYNLKQWCGNVNHNKLEKIRSLRTGEEITLPRYVDLKEEDLDPIELYAYYIGLYINNMRNKIYLRYIMSFPVTYEKRVREKILASFRKGLKKSLPETVVKDEETMKRFEVVEGAGEPASYAVCALKEFECAPDDESSILYGVFDFGGGTTDYDYGIWRCADEESIDEERYDYVIEHFGAAGSQYLGGENLLELLAFEIFKANKETLLKEKIKFTKPVYMDSFDEMEDLVDDTQIANRNTKQLAEQLRSFLENSISLKEEKAFHFSDGEPDDARVEKIISYLAATGQRKVTYDELCLVISDLIEKGIISSTVTKEDIKAVADNLNVTIPDEKSVNKFSISEIVSNFEPLKSGSLKVGLFSSDGEFKADTELYIMKDNKVLVNLLEILISSIENGVKNFCQAFMQAISTPEFKARNLKISNIYIFLAGNSSKSPIVKNLFNKYIHEYFPDICKLFGIDFDKNLFLMPPLGSEEADAILKNHGKAIDDSSLTRPTGKTGVVYGLIDSRKGGTILVKNSNTESNEIPFKYFVGIKKRNLFKSKISKNAGYGEWVRLVNAQIQEFEIYYSSLPEALTGSLSITDTSIKKKNLKIKETSDDQDVSIYIRASKPSTIEYCVANSEGIKSNEYLQEPVEVDLV